MNIHDSELKSCPFCKRPATIVRNPGSNWDGSEGEHVNIGAGHGLWFVGCSYSFFEGLDKFPDCNIVPAAKWYSQLEEAIKAWNTRGGDDDLK
jgi:hypothetical protein